mmetsp:Transcript_14892/g.25936  ORF Transcript_14892/g.25936 Transcript_14892/m.25936 type:complete len:101 (-) Transcript_14892:34-336(-)
MSRQHHTLFPQIYRRCLFPSFQWYPSYYSLERNVYAPCNVFLLSVNGLNMQMQAANFEQGMPLDLLLCINLPTVVHDLCSGYSHEANEQPPCDTPPYHRR